jgi:uncharacterized membrane protein YuzA (DUF378 family)
MMNGNCGHKCGGCVVAKTVKTLLWVGGLNWGLVGLGMLLGKGDAWNVVNIVLGSMPTLEAVVYVLVGVSAIMVCVGCKCKKCMEGCATCQVGAVDQNM